MTLRGERKRGEGRRGEERLTVGCWLWKSHCLAHLEQRQQGLSIYIGNAQRATPAVFVDGEHRVSGSWHSEPSGSRSQKAED